MTTPTFDGVLFFPVTPFDERGEVDEDLLQEHVSSGVRAGAGGVFPACGTGEFHALSAREAASVTAVAVETVAGRVPVISGVGGSIPNAIAAARSAKQSGSDGILLLPPYLVAGPEAGLRAYVEAVVDAADLPVILYNRGTARYSPSLMRTLVADQRVMGFKDGVGDVAAAQEVVAAVTVTQPDFAFFNGLLTAELSQGAYAGIGIRLYSSAVFAMAPEIATAYYRAYQEGREDDRLRLLREFYGPLVALRDETPGFGVSLIKAGLRLSGIPVGGVRAPLVDPSAEQERRLAALLRHGRTVAAEQLSAAAA